MISHQMIYPVSSITTLATYSTVFNTKSSEGSIFSYHPKDMHIFPPLVEKPFDLSLDSISFKEFFLNLHVQLLSLFQIPTTSCSCSSLSHPLRYLSACLHHQWDMCYMSTLTMILFHHLPKHLAYTWIISLVYFPWSYFHYAWLDDFLTPYHFILILAEFRCTPLQANCILPPCSPYSHL